MKYLILTYGKSPEREVSLMSCKYICDGLSKLGYEYEIIHVKDNNIFALENGKEIDLIKYYNDKCFDGVVNSMHGVYCEDGTIQGLLDYYEIPYTGADIRVSSICIDKEFTKKVADAVGVPIIEFVTVDYSKNINLEEIIQKAENKIKYPMFVKATNGGSSVGTHKVNNKNELKQALQMSRSLSNKIIIEKEVIGREIEVAVISSDKEVIISNPGEIKYTSEFYDYDAKYSENSGTTLQIPANIDKDVSEQLRNYAKRIYDFIDINSYARIDFFYDENNNNIYLLEINTLPGMTKYSMFPELLNEIGYSGKDIIDMIIKNMKNRMKK